MSGKNVVIGAFVGSIFGLVGGMYFGISGWLLGGVMAGVTVGEISPDLAAALFHSAGSGGCAGLILALVFGLGIGVQFVQAAGDLALLAWGLNPFFSIALVYGPGSAIIASITGGLFYSIRTV